ncbi:MAG: hypothetical protein Q6365_023850 [Candidatus Sigynarchaeota archaeon]
MNKMDIIGLRNAYKQQKVEKHEIGKTIYVDEPRCWRCRLRRLPKVAAE